MVFSIAMMPSSDASASSSRIISGNESQGTVSISSPSKCEPKYARAAAS